MESGVEGRGLPEPALTSTASRPDKGGRAHPLKPTFRPPFALGTFMAARVTVHQRLRGSIAVIVAVVAASAAACGADAESGDAASQEREPVVEADARTEFDPGQSAYLAWRRAQFESGGFAGENLDDLMGMVTAALARATPASGTISFDGRELDLERLGCWQEPTSTNRWAIVGSSADGGWIKLTESGLDRRDAFVSGYLGEAYWTDAFYLENPTPFVLGADGITGDIMLHQVDAAQRVEALLVVDVAC